MIRSLRASLALAAALALSACASFPSLPAMPHFALPKFAVHAPAAPAAATAAKARPGEWPQAHSDLAADPDIRFGSLPNGLRYAIRRQVTPPGQAALRLRIDAGSLEETDEQQGLAHFLEHMAFNGSKAVPEGEMVKILERLGLAFGADTNASTDFDETIYKLDLPHTDDETVDTSLMLLRETASNLTIEPAAVDRERGVVLSEERSRDGPSYRVFKGRMEFLLAGLRPPTRQPIGKVEILRNAPASRIVDYYRRYYRPDRAVVVAVGDFDVEAMEARIRARFGDWAGEGPAGTDPDLGAVPRRGPEAKVVVEPGAPLNVQINWIRPPDLAPDTRAKRREDLYERLAYSVLNRRFSRLSRSAEPPFLAAGASQTDWLNAAEASGFAFVAEPGRLLQALEAVEKEQRRAVQFGVRQDELDREIEEMRASLKADASGAATRRPAQIAGDILGSLTDDEVVTSPADDLALFEAAVKDLKAETVSKTLRGLFRGQGPLIFAASPQAIAGGEAAVLAAWKASAKAAVEAPAAPTVVSWPYAGFGTPGKVVEQTEVADLDTVFVRFENGVRLTIKPTKFQDDEVLVRVNIGDGLVDFPRDRSNVSWGANAYIEGGLKQITAEDMERVLASNLYGGRFGVAEDAFVLSGSTRPADLDVQLQVLAAYLAEPGWRPEAFQRVKGSGKTIHDQFESTASGVAGRDLQYLLHAGDQRWRFPSREEIASASLDDFRTLIMRELQVGPVEVVIVGDTTVERAVEAVAATLGALPARSGHVLPGPDQRTVAFPGPVAEPVTLTHKGRADQAMGFIAWPTTGFFADTRLARETAVLSEVLELRLIDELREAQGATYSPNASSSHSFVWPGYGYVAATVEVPPDKLPDFFADVRKIAADLRSREISADELARARQPRIERIEKARVTNGYWLGELSGAQADPRRLEATRSAIPGTERVTAADIRRAAERYLRDDKAWMLQIVPAKK